MDVKESLRLRKLALIARVGLIHLSREGVLESLTDVPEDNPLYMSPSLRERLMKGVREQEVPYLYCDSFEVFFACIQAEDGFYFLGPMSLLSQSDVNSRCFYNSYGMKEEDFPRLRTYSRQQVLYTVEIFAQELTGKDYGEEELLQCNHLAGQSPDLQKRELALFSLAEEEENEEGTWRHSYRQECDMMQAVREGRAEDALRINREMDEDAGRFSLDDLSHWKSLAIIGLTLTSRAAIEGGLSPDAAYRVSGYYIQKCDSALTSSQARSLRDEGIRELTRRVGEKIQRTKTSNYTETCKNYISLHYREKLYLEDIAGELGISPTYLSRRFKEDTGIRLQDYINLVRVDRAANMLRYSDLSLSEIAEYVHFPSQSYFGKIFRQQLQMTPRQYRDKYKAAEWSGK